MNAMMTFFKGILTGYTTGQKPVGLTGFKACSSAPAVAVKKHISKQDIRLSDLMRKVH